MGTVEGRGPFGVMLGNEMVGLHTYIHTYVHARMHAYIHGAII